MHPSFIVLAKDVQSEALFMLLLLASALFLLSSWDTSRVALAVAAGTTLGLAILTRPSALLLLLLVPVLLVARRTPSAPRVVAAAVLTSVAVVMPWTVRNRLAYGAWIPVSDQLGLVLYQGNSEMNERYYRLRSRGDYEQWAGELNADVDRGRIRALAGPPGTNPEVRSRAFTNAALEWIREHPRRAVRLFLHKAADWVRPWPSPFGWPAAVVIAVGIYNSLLCAAAAGGLCAAPRRGIAAAALLILLGTMAAHVVLLAIWRYRIVYWDPVLVLFASYGLVTIFGRRAPREMTC
jgi:4-amino-4-deoxy-L-arabinose transferase-like glycosyltransferase